MTVTSDSEDGFPTSGALLGIDFGTKRLGFAVCDRDQTIASPVQNYDRGNAEQDARAVRKLIEDYRIVGLILGLPVHMSGDESEKSIESRQFGAWLRSICECPLRFWDERFSSQLADDLLIAGEFTNKKKKARRDMLAAQGILQSYLDADDKSGRPTDLRE